MFTAAIVALVMGAAVGYPVGLLTRASIAVAPSATPAVALYRQALAATSRSVGFHYVSSATGDPSNQRTVGDAGVSGGDQLITLTSAYGSERFALVMVSEVVYFQGNVPALEDQLGIAALNAAGLAGKWVSVSRGDGPYVVIEPGITVSDQANCIVLTPTSVAKITTPTGRIEDRIAGTVAATRPCTFAATGHLDVARGSHLPSAFVWTRTGGGSAATYTTIFTGWGAAPSTTVPTGAVAWSTLGATEPPTGYGGGGVATNPAPTLPA